MVPILVPFLFAQKHNPLFSVAFMVQTIGLVIRGLPFFDYLRSGDFRV